MLFSTPEGASGFGSTAECVFRVKCQPSSGYHSFTQASYNSCSGPMTERYSAFAAGL
jgi:hypothetical protein